VRAPDDLQAANANAARALQTKLECALRKLPIADPQHGIPYSTVIPGVARDLTTFARRDPDRAANASAREKALKLVEQIEKLPFAAQAAAGTELAVVVGRLLAFAKPAGRGGQRKASARRVIEHLAEEYFRLTGKKATRRDAAFQRLVRDVLAALRMKGSPDWVLRSDRQRGAE
jgi:hypothetical protein